MVSVGSTSALSPFKKLSANSPSANTSTLSSRMVCTPSSPRVTLATRTRDFP